MMRRPKLPGPTIVLTLAAATPTACSGARADGDDASDTGTATGLEESSAATAAATQAAETAAADASSTDDGTGSSTEASAGTSDGGTTGGEVGCKGDWVAAWLEANPLQPGEWSTAIDGMGGLNEYHDPDTREGPLRYNNELIDGDTITFEEAHALEVGDDVLLLQTTLSGQVHSITATTELTITIDGSVDAPGQINVVLFPDYYTRSLPFEDEAGGQFLDWNAQFYYDATTGMHTIGGGVGSSPSYDDAQYKTWRVRYDPCQNRWYKVWNPLGNGGSHHYASNALDPAGRRYFRGVTAFDLDDDMAPGMVLPDTPDDGGTANTYLYHEGLARLYRMTSDGRVRWWSEGTGWSERETLDGMDDHPLSAYLSETQTAVFGGGNDPADAFYKIDATGVITELDDIPVELRTFNAVRTMMLDVGFADRLVIVRDEYEGGVGNPMPQVWWLLPDAPSGEQWQVSPDMIPPELASYGGVKRELAATPLRHLGVVMVMRYWGSGTLDHEDPAQRRAAVWFYRPSAQ